MTSPLWPLNDIIYLKIGMVDKVIAGKILIYPGHFSKPGELSANGEDLNFKPGRSRKCPELM
jgi:hypothetical protein